ncbi:class I SAM-dependent methyltransferase [Crossiella cryophila]|uniref:SAM-dependent methyltransferase n=1 Tax=Crossiella cryophila TaxID=43355 RepID=A0A7W7CHQ0_9PSEU|nr:class I SAM-dependent methyltransferase [Crossiella cryophila]MBB4681434.1 SAM-dependent methyltransferase [Crossiella cryophila]
MGARKLDVAQGRHLFGQDPESYDAGRPDYPDRVYEILTNECGLGPGTRVIEIGPATGLVTRRLLARGAAVTAVEPSAPLADFLRRTHDNSALEVITAPFEEAGLPEGGFDLAVAATSFHWVDLDTGLAKLRRIVRPGGWVALWWMMFEDPARPHAFDAAAEEILGMSPGTVMDPGGPPFQLDAELHRAYFAKAGFTEFGGEVIRSELRMDAARLRTLYASMALVLSHPPEERAQLLDALETLVHQRFGGEVVRPFVTGFYRARNPRRAGSR